MWDTHVHIPAEKGMNAFRVTNFPSSFKKCAGLNVCGVSHSPSSARTDVSKGRTAVPCKHKCNGLHLTAGWRDNDPVLYLQYVRPCSHSHLIMLMFHLLQFCAIQTLHRVTVMS